MENLRYPLFLDSGPFSLFVANPYPNFHLKYICNVQLSIYMSETCSCPSIMCTWYYFDILFQPVFKLFLYKQTLLSHKLQKIAHFNPMMTFSKGNTPFVFFHKEDAICSFWWMLMFDCDFCLNVPSLWRLSLESFEFVALWMGQMWKNGRK